MRYAITFGDSAIVNIGAEEHHADIDFDFKGFSYEKLRELSCENNWEFIDLSWNEEKASILIIPFGDVIDEELAEELYIEQSCIEYDKKYYDFKKKKTLNNIARYKVTFGETSRPHNEDYTEHTIISFDDVPYLKSVREFISSLVGFQPLAEGNQYYNEKSGIGFHGDKERNIVVCLSLGDTTNLVYEWRAGNSETGTPPPKRRIKINHGDIYIMSEKAVGKDWLHRSKNRLVHAAGSSKYTS